LALEFGPVQIPPTNEDVVVLAGDVHVGPKGCAWAQTQFPAKPIVYVLGNHEFYRHSLPELAETLKREMSLVQPAS
jgi:predicted phosphodiesterase